MRLADFRHRPGTKLRTELGTPIMVLSLCPGMIREGVEPSGGHETVAVVSLETGKTTFEHETLEVVAAREA